MEQRLITSFPVWWKYHFMIGGEVLTQLSFNASRRLQTDEASRSGWDIMNWYWAVICRYTIQKFIKVIISKTIIFSRHIFGIIASMIYGSSRPRPRGESGVSSHRKYMIEKYMGKIWIKIQFHLTVSNTSEPQSSMPIFVPKVPAARSHRVLKARGHFFQ